MSLVSADTMEDAERRRGKLSCRGWTTSKSARFTAPLKVSFEITKYPSFNESGFKHFLQSEQEDNERNKVDSLMNTFFDYIKDTPLLSNW